MKKYLKGPSISTVYNWINKENHPKFEDFKKKKKTHIIINFWKNVFKFDNIKCTIAVDAMKVDENLSIDHKNSIDGVIDKLVLKNRY